jgi:hypothetical protein
MKGKSKPSKKGAVSVKAPKRGTKALTRVSKRVTKGIDQSTRGW